MLTVRPGFGTHRLRLSATPSDADELRLARADRAGLDAAADRVAERFCGFRLDRVDRTLATTTPMVLDVSPKFLSDLGGITALDEALRGVDAGGTLARILPGSNVAVADLVRPCPDPGGPGRLRALPTAEAVVAGTTLILNDIGGRARAALGELVDDTSRVTGTEARVNAYVSERGETGFGWHWDDHDVIIVQLTGSKLWRIFEPHELAPLRGWTSNTTRGRETASVLVRPGMGLLVPRGWGHQVRGFEGELSSHLTMSVTRPRARSLIEVAAVDSLDAGRAAEVVSVDRPATAPLRLDDAMLEHFRGVLRARMVSQTADDPIEVAAARSASADVLVRGCFTGGAVFADHPERRRDQVVLAAAGHLIRLPRALVGAMSALLEGQPQTVDALAARSPESTVEQVKALVSALATVDLVRVGTAP